MKDLKELAAYAKANPGKLNVGIPGNGTLGHITSVLVQKELGISMTNVPYRGTALVINDLLGGQVDLAMDFMPSYVPLVREGKIRALAVTTTERSSDLPDVKTVQEAGFKGFEATAWYALAAPAGTPSEIIDKLNAATNAFLKSPKGQDVLAKLGMQARRRPAGRSEGLHRLRAAEVGPGGEGGEHLDVTASAVGPRAGRAMAKYLEDFREGEVWQSGSIVIGEDEMVAYAKANDPQPIHVDPDAARNGPFGGIIASGWQIAALSMRLFVEAGGYGDAPIVGIGIDELRWKQVVRPGDALRTHP